MGKPEGCVILDLCGGSGSWSRPYVETGYRVVLVDPNPSPDVFGYDVVPLSVRDFDPRTVGETIHGVLAAPPCTEFSGSGARWWKHKSPALLEEAIAVVESCLSIINEVSPRWWCLENPVGRLPDFIGPWVETFQPWEFGDPYTKRTCLWGSYKSLVKSPVEPTEGGKIWRMPPSPDRARLRSLTPPGFAKAFFEANP